MGQVDGQERVAGVVGRLRAFQAHSQDRVGVVQIQLFDDVGGVSVLSADDDAVVPRAGETKRCFPGRAGG